MAFSNDFLITVKDRNPIEDVIGQYVPLKRAGSNLVGICPFHSEKTPSFTVFPSTSSYYCFGCGAGGDVITFVMQTENSDYKDAVESLARRAGVPIEETVKGDVTRNADAVRKERVYEVTKEAARYKPLAIHILPSGDENAVHWFLEDKIDTRSSNYLEDAATEIQVQGLELDFTCLLWDADMRYKDGEWRYYRFNGSTKWNEIKGDTESQRDQMKYMLNAYRVLLTRAREGMVICIPKGNGNKKGEFWEDSTRLPEYYDGTYQYLKGLGIEEI